jgi:hypothetical protein
MEDILFKVNQNSLTDEQRHEFVDSSRVFNLSAAAIFAHVGIAEAQCVSLGEIVGQAAKGLRGQLRIAESAAHGMSAMIKRAQEEAAAAVSVGFHFDPSWIIPRAPRVPALAPTDITELEGVDVRPSVEEQAQEAEPLARLELASPRIQCRAVISDGPFSARFHWFEKDRRGLAVCHEEQMHGIRQTVRIYVEEAAHEGEVKLAATHTRNHQSGACIASHLTR